jgi:tRNA1Val (adenine37-N6)-methyltransferase
VEIDAMAFEQAKQNIAASPWNATIMIHHTDIVNFFPGKKYDHIICNPPFFEADLLSADKKKNAAKHDTALTLTELLKTIDRLLSANGIFAVLLPFHRSEYFKAAAGNLNFYLAKEINVKQTARHNYFRAILIFSRTSTVVVPEEITIKEEDGNYTAAFTALLKDYYLYL